MNYVFALLDQDGDFLDYAFYDEDDAQSIASTFEKDASKAGIKLDIKIDLMDSRSLPNFVEII